MSIIDTTRTPSATRGIIARALTDTLATLAAWKEQRATRDALNKLSDRELDDIGLCRGDIDVIARRI